MRPVLIINDIDYAEYIAELKPVKNDLDADGSGRDIQTGTMYRTKVTDKLTWEVSMLRIPESVAASLFSAINSDYYDATLLHPGTNTQVEKEYYTSAITFGAQKYIRSSGITVYDGVTFQMIER